MRRGVLVAGACAGLLAGCGSGSFRNENDALRERVMDLETALAQETRHREELEGRLAAEATANAGDVPADVLMHTPVLARITIGARSHAFDADGDGAVDRVRLLVLPEDGRGRFLQVTGTLAAHVGRLPADDDARTLGRLTLGPSALRDAYRATLFGTHYLVEVPIAGAAAGETLDARVRFTDGRTGRNVEAHAAIRIDG